MKKYEIAKLKKDIKKREAIVGRAVKGLVGSVTRLGSAKSSPRKGAKKASAKRATAKKTTGKRAKRSTSPKPRKTTSRARTSARRQRGGDATSGPVIGAAKING